MRGCASCSRCVCPCSKLVCACVAAGVIRFKKIKKKKNLRRPAQGETLRIQDGYRSVSRVLVVSSSRLHEQMCRTSRHVFH